jgi:ABC-type polysaccharide transport system permease subunit
MKTLVHVPGHGHVARRLRIPLPSMGTLMLILLMLKIGADVLRRRREARLTLPEPN